MLRCLISTKTKSIKTQQHRKIDEIDDIHRRRSKPKIGTGNVGWPKREIMKEKLNGKSEFKAVFFFFFSQPFVTQHMVLLKTPSKDS